VPRYYFILVLNLELKKVAVISFMLAFTSKILITLTSVFLQAIGMPGPTGILKYGLVMIILISLIYGVVGVVAFWVFVLSAFGIAVQKFPGRDDDLEI
jgi:hypothetical protein